MKIYQKKSYLLLYILGCLFFVILSVFFLKQKYLEAWFPLIFFGCFCLPKTIYSFIKPKLMLELSDDGFYCDSFGYIKWDNITDFSLLNFQKTKIIFFNTKIPLENHKSTQYFNQALYGYNYAMSLAGTGINIEEIYLLMSKSLPNIKN